MIARTRLIATLVAVAGLALACRDSTGIDTHGKNGLQLPPGDRDLSKVAGTYAHPQEPTSQLILLATGSFTSQYEASDRIYSQSGRFVRVDSNLVLTFTDATRERDVIVSGLLRADTIFVYSLSLVPEEIPVLHYSFVKVRGP